MVRFDVYANPDTAGRRLIPYLLDVQNDHVRGLQTRVMVPLWNSSMLPMPVSDLNPAFEVAGQRVIMDTAALGAVPLSALKGSVGNLGLNQLRIQNALDVLFGSY